MSHLLARTHTHTGVQHPHCVSTHNVVQRPLICPAPTLRQHPQCCPTPLATVGADLFKSPIQLHSYNCDHFTSPNLHHTSFKPPLVAITQHSGANLYHCDKLCTIFAWWKDISLPSSKCQISFISHQSPERQHATKVNLRFLPDPHSHQSTAPLPAAPQTSSDRRSRWHRHMRPRRAGI